MNNGNGKDKQDFLGDGYHRLDDELISRTPPRIAWGEGYKMMTDAQKIDYLEKLASTMNHAAFLIQNERNDLVKLYDNKERKVEAMSKALDANNSMMQQQITKMNADKQEYFKSIARLNETVREYENAYGRLGD